MITPNLIILYVENPERSKVFYEKLLGQAPVTTFPSWVAFEFDNGLALGLWSTSARDFTTSGTGQRSELSFMVQSDTEVRSLYQKWCEAGMEIEQPPGEAVFGLTFVAQDPDGHRIRVCTPDD